MVRCLCLFKSDFSPLCALEGSGQMFEPFKKWREWEYEELRTIGADTGCHPMHHIVGSDFSSCSANISLCIYHSFIPKLHPRPPDYLKKALKYPKLIVLDHRPDDVWKALFPLEQDVTNFGCQGQGEGQWSSTRKCLELWKSTSARAAGSEVKHKSGGKEQSQLCHSHFLNILRITSDSSGHWQRSK